MTEIIYEMNHRYLDTPPTLLVPLTASTEHQAVDLGYIITPSLTVELGLPVLTLAERMRIVTAQCVRVADSNGRLASEKLPGAVVDCLALVGGSPRLLSYFMEAIAVDGDWMLGAKLMHVHSTCKQRAFIHRLSWLSVFSRTWEEKRLSCPCI